MKPGYGFDSIFGKSRGQCVDFEGVEAREHGQEVVYALRVIKNHRQLAAAMNLSAAQQIKGAIPDTNVNVSGKSKFAVDASHAINRYSVFAVVDVKVRNETTDITRPQLASDVRADLEKHLDTGDEVAMAAAVNRFRLRCGDSFLTSYTTGGEFYGIVEIATESTEDKVQVTRAIEAAVGVDGLGEVSSASELGATLKRVAENRRISIRTFQQGGAGEDAAPVTTVAQMVERAESLPAAVSREGQPRRLLATFVDYYTLDLPIPAAYRRKILVAERFMQRLADIQATLLDQRADIDYLLDHPNAFEGVRGNRLTAFEMLREQIQHAMRDVYDLAFRCHLDLEDCALPADFELPSVALPERRPTIIEVSRDVVQIQTRQTFFDPDHYYDHWFNAPECYVRVVVGANQRGWRALRRSRTVPGCGRQDYSWRVPLAQLREVARELGTTVDELWIEVEILEDDLYGQDDLIGATYQWYRRLDERSAIPAVISAAGIVMEVAFSVE